MLHVYIYLLVIVDLPIRHGEFSSSETVNVYSRGW